MSFDYSRDIRHLPEMPEVPFVPYNPFFAEDKESIDTDALLSSVEERQKPFTLTLGDVVRELEGAMMDD